MKSAANEKLTEKKLADSFDEVQSEVAEQIRKYEQQYPELARRIQTGDEVVRQPVYRYDVRAAS